MTPNQITARPLSLTQHAHKLQPEAINYGQPENPRSVPKRAKTGSAPNDTNVTTVTLADAAVALGLKLGTLRRLIGEGLPVVRRADAKGGRGSTTWLHVPTCRQWLAARQQPGQPVEALLLQLAAELPAVVAAGLDDAARLCDGPHKRDLLRVLPGVWWLVATAVRDHLVEHGAPPMPDLTRDDMPTSMARLLDSKLQSKR